MNKTLCKAKVGEIETVSDMEAMTWELLGKLTWIGTMVLCELKREK